jgi:hypothetical protein
MWWCNEINLVRLVIHMRPAGGRDSSGRLGAVFRCDWRQTRTERQKAKSGFSMTDTQAAPKDRKSPRLGWTTCSAAPAAHAAIADTRVWIDTWSECWRSHRAS